MKEFTFTFPFTRRDTVKSPVNPAEKNGKALHNGFLEIVRELPTKDMPFVYQLPLELTLRNSDVLPVVLSYESGITNIRDGRILHTRLRLLDGTNSVNQKEIAKRRWVAPISKYSTVDISSYSMTKKGWEGNGFGTALIMLSDTVVLDLITRFNSLFMSRGVKATIFDASFGQSTYVREKWTTNMALRLGYKNTGGSTFEKKYK